MTELPVTQEMVLLCAFIRVLLSFLPRWLRRPIMRRMTEFMVELADSDAWSAHVLIDTKADEHRLTVRRSAAAHWEIIRRAVERETG